MTRPTAQADRRAFGRRESHIRAVVEVSGRPAVHCIVRNFSRGGALIDLSEPIGIDQDLHLAIDSYDFAAYCDVRHRNGLTIGVSFHQTMDAAGEARLAGQAEAEAVMEKTTGAALRKSLRIGQPEPEPVIVRPYRGPSILRNP